MVSGRLKSKRLAKTNVKCARDTKTHYRQRNRKIAKCAITGKALRGIPRLTNTKFSNLSHSKKTVSRPYGGYMSHTALKDKILKEIVLKDQD